MLQHLEKKLHLKTIFNMLGPITNPANAQIQLIGVFDINTMQLVADSLMELGTSKALVLNSGMEWMRPHLC